MNISDLASRLRLNGPFIKPVFTLVSGIALGQGITFLARPILTRLFTPEEFGVLTLFVSITGLLTAISSGRYDDALMLPKSNKDSGGLLFLSLFLASIVGVLLFISQLWTEPISSLLQSPNFATVFFLMPITVVLAAWAHSHEVWHVRFDRFKLVSGSKILQHTSGVAVKVVTGLLGVGAIGLVIGATASVLVAFTVLGIATLYLDRHLVLSSIRHTRVRILARRYWRFPAFSVPAALLNLLSNHVPIILLAAFFGERTVGFFGLALGTLYVPVRTFTHAVGQVFFVRAAEAFRNQKLGSLTELVSRRLTAVALLPMIVVAFFGPDLFGFVYGEPWRTAGQYGQFLSGWLLFATIASPLTKLFDITQHQRADLVLGIILFTSQATALFLTRNAADPIVAIAAISVVGCATRLIQITYLLHIGRASAWLALKDLVLHIAMVAVALGPSIVIHLMGGSIWLLCVAILFGAAVYAIVVVRLDWKTPKYQRSDDL